MEKVLGIDLDGTLADTIDEWLYLYNKDNKSNYKKSIMNIFGIDKVIPIEKSTVKYYFEKSWENWRDVKVVDKDEVKVIKKLSSKYKIRIVTATYGKSEHIKKWLDENEIYYDEIVRCHSSNKFKYCDILIDDKIEETNIVAMNGKIGILIEQPWSRAYKDEPINDKVKIVSNWGSILNLLMVK